MQGGREGVQRYWPLTSVERTGYAESSIEVASSSRVLSESQEKLVELEQSGDSRGQFRIPDFQLKFTSGGWLGRGPRWIAVPKLTVFEPRAQREPARSDGSDRRQRQSLNTIGLVLLLYDR
jgi:hypothetical protein